MKINCTNKMIFVLFATFYMIFIAFNIYAQDKPENLNPVSLPTETTPITIIITSIISTLAIVVGVCGTIHFARKSAKIEERLYKLKVTPVLELKPGGGTRSGLREFSTKIKITNKGQLQTTIKKIKIECIIPGYITEISKSFPKNNVLAPGDSIEQSVGFNQKDILAAMISGEKKEEKIDSQDIKFKWNINCIGADDKKYPFERSGHL